jgi:hypothetical protein
MAGWIVSDLAAETAIIAYLTTGFASAYFDAAM